MDSKILRMEDQAEPECSCSRYNIFKYFLVINFLIFLVFCCFSMWSLHQLGKAMRSKEPTIRLAYVDPTTPTPPDDNHSNLLDVVSNAMREFGVEQMTAGANLTDFEIHILREYAKMKRSKRSLGCDNLNITIDTGDEQDSLRVQVKPAQYGQGKVNVKNVVSYPNGTSESRVQECAFDVTYEPKEQT